MRIGLVDLDSKVPNLALMKLSAYHKQRGDEVHLAKGQDLMRFDKVYVSCIYSWNRWRAESIRFLHPNVELGGSGVDLQNSLPDEIEHLMPDYKLYNIDYSIGFTTRGCYRRCPWCVVPEKEGFIHHHASIKEFHHPSHEKIWLLDNNILASDTWFETFRYLIRNRLKISFFAGLDIRLIDDEKATMLSKMNYMDFHFKTKRLYFAWDILNDESLVLKGIEILLKHDIKPSHLMFFILCGFNTSLEEDMYRFKKLDDLGCKPYIMLYDKFRIKHPKELRRFQRWVNRRYYKVCSFKDYSS